MVIGRCGRKLTPEGNRGKIWLSRYVAPETYDLAPPAQLDVGGNVKYSWWDNNSLQDCTIAALAKMIEQRCAIVGEPCKLTVDHVRAAYSKATGWDPKDPQSDRGGQMRDALKVATTDGIGPYVLGPYARVNVRDPVEYRAALWLGGSVYIGADLPRRVLEQKDRWAIAAKPGELDRVRSLGGHAYLGVGAEKGRHHAIPWVDRVMYDDHWHESYVDEGYVIFDRLWLAYLRSRGGIGIDADRLMRDLHGIGRADLVNPFF